MNIALERVFEGIVKVMRADVIPNVSDPFARGQAVGVIDLINNVAARIEWARAPLLGAVKDKQRLLRVVAEALGEEAVDGALKKLLATYAFKPAPYPSTTDFLAFLRQEAPGHDQLISDLFERITLYDMKARDATAHKLPDGRCEVRFTVEGRKLYADGQGKEKEVPLYEPFDVGAFTAEPGKKGFSRDSVLQVERISITGPRQTVTMVLDKLPRFIGVDPFNERIDRNSNDNLTTVKFQ